MAEEPGSREAPGIYLDLAVLPPTPGRLVEIVKLVADCGYGRVAVDWGSTFPWSLDVRFRAGHACPEEVVAAIARQVAAASLELIPVAPAPDSLEFIYRRSGYRHLFRRGETGLALNIASAGGAKLYRDLVEDMLELLPGSRTVAFAPAALLGPSMEGWVGELAERGVRARPLFASGPQGMAGEPQALPPRADALFLCDGRAEPDSSERQRAAASVLFSFQAPRGSPLLRRPIELALDWVADRAPAPVAGSALRGVPGREGREAADRLELLLTRAWAAVRAIREGLALAVLSDEAETGSLERLLSLLEADVAACSRSGDELFSLLKENIESEPLQAALGSLIEPLEEELHLFIPRVQLLGRRSSRL